MISKKVCLIGDFGVGKTSLIRRFVDRQFSDQYLSTVGVKISRKQVDLSQPDYPKTGSVQLLLWDIEGHTKFKAIAPSYLQGASGAVIVADVTRAETVHRLPEHINLFLKINPKGWMVLALNKTDLVEPEEADSLLTQIPPTQPTQILSTYLTSAKTGDHVDEMFHILSYQFLSKS